MVRDLVGSPVIFAIIDGIDDLFPIFLPRRRIMERGDSTGKYDQTLRQKQFFHLCSCVIVYSVRFIEAVVSGIRSSIEGVEVKVPFFLSRRRIKAG